MNRRDRSRIKLFMETTVESESNSPAGEGVRCCPSSDVGAVRKSINPAGQKLDSPAIEIGKRRVRSR